MKLVIKMKEGHHNNLALQLQRLESSIFIKGVASKLCKLDKWFSTIHDSIVCKEEDIELVSSLILEEYSKRGLYPTLKINKI